MFTRTMFLSRQLCLNYVNLNKESECYGLLCKDSDKCSDKYLFVEII